MKIMDKRTILSMAIVALMLATPFTLIQMSETSDAAASSIPSASDYGYVLTYDDKNINIEKVESYSKSTKAYTTELTNRVEGLVMDEKKVARSEQSRSRPLISSKRAVSASSRP